MVCGYLLFNKVHSPQFALWLLPFFVLLRIRAGWILAYFVADAAIGIGFFRWQYLIGRGLPSGSYDALSPQLVLIGVWGRAALLVALIVVFLRARVVEVPAAEGPGPSPGARRVAVPVRRAAPARPRWSGSWCGSGPDTRLTENTSPRTGPDRTGPDGPDRSGPGSPALSVAPGGAHPPGLAGERAGGGDLRGDVPQLAAHRVAGRWSAARRPRRC